MAEAAAVVGLVASIITLVDLTTKIVSRIHDFTSQSSEVPKSLRALADRLPLLSQTLQRIQARVQAGHVPNDVAENLKKLVDSINVQIGFLEQCLAKITPPADASRLARGIKALQSLLKDDQVIQAVEKVHNGIDVLVLHQTTTNIDLSDQIILKLDSLKLDAHVTQQAFGLWLDQAPQIDPRAFLGRTTELQQLDDWLSPGSNTQSQRIVSIVGMGGLGKTQLSLAYTRQYGGQYSSVFWLNAKDKLSLQQSLLTLSNTIFAEGRPEASGTSDRELQIQKVRKWLSEPWNDRWLIILDNYDDPDLPNVRSPTGFDVRSFFPSRAQGSILITTRSPKLTFSRQLMLQKLDDTAIAVDILSQRAGRVLSSEAGAYQLATRMDGLPLALAMAGTYIGQTGCSCAEYLEMYEELWSELHGSESERLLEYTDRTLSSTWTLSLGHVSRHDSDAAELFKFFALLNNADLWYGMLRAGATHGPQWLDRVTSSKLRFDRAITKLRDYSLIEAASGSYSVHPCIHDWLLGQFQLAPIESWFLTALSCVKDSIPNELDTQYWAVSRRLLQHMQRLTCKPFQCFWNAYADAGAFLALDRFGRVHYFLSQLKEAERMFTQALVGTKKMLGSEPLVTARTMSNLGLLYTEEGKLTEAEEMFTRALEVYETVAGSEHTQTLGLVLNLGRLYWKQDKLTEAECMYTRALTGFERTLGPEDMSTTEAVDHLGALFVTQNRLVEAEQMFTRALAGRRKLDSGHALILRTVYHLGIVYMCQDRLAEAQQMCERALNGFEKLMGPNHEMALKTVDSIGFLYVRQKKFVEAEQMYKRALTGIEAIFGSENRLTLGIVNDLRQLYLDQRRSAEVEDLDKRYHIAGGHR